MVRARRVRKTLQKSSMNHAQLPTFAELMTALIQIQDNQTQIMNGILDIQYNQAIGMEFQAAVADIVEGPGSVTSNNITAVLSTYLAQLGSS